MQNAIIENSLEKSALMKKAFNPVDTEIEAALQSCKLRYNDITSPKPPEFLYSPFRSTPSEFSKYSISQSSDSKSRHAVFLRFL